MIDPGALITVFFFKSPLLIIIIRPLIDTVICVKEFLIMSKCMHVFFGGNHFKCEQLYIHLQVVPLLLLKFFNKNELSHIRIDH